MEPPCQVYFVFHIEEAPSNPHLSVASRFHIPPLAPHLLVLYCFLPGCSYVIFPLL